MLESELVRASDTNFDKYWAQLEFSDAFHNPLHAVPFRSATKLSGSDIEHQSASFQVNQPSFTSSEDFSFVLLEGDLPKLGCSLLLHTDRNGHRKLGYLGVGAATHYCANILDSKSNNLSPDAFSTLMKHMNQLITELKPDVVEFWDAVNYGLMSPVTQCLVSKGASLLSESAYMLDTTASRRSLLHDASKLARGYIHWGQRNLHFSVRSDSLAFYDYLNRNKQTCSKAYNPKNVALWNSEDSLKSLARAGTAFLVDGYLKGQLAATAVFFQSKGLCQYLGCSVYEAAGDKPVLHSLFWQALLHAKSADCKGFELDHRFNQKSVEMIDFGGFAGKEQARLKVFLDLNKIGK